MTGSSDFLVEHLRGFGHFHMFSLPLIVSRNFRSMGNKVEYELICGIAVPTYFCRKYTSTRFLSLVHGTLTLLFQVSNKKV